MSTLDVMRMLKNDALRLADHPGLQRAGLALLQESGDQHLVEVFRWGVERQVAQLTCTSDPFYGVYPPRHHPLDFDVPIVRLPDGRGFGIKRKSLFRNTAIIGPTGAGKSSILRLLLWLTANWACVIVVDRKRELRNLRGFPDIGGRWLVFSLAQLSKKISFLAPPPCVPRETWACDIVDLVARNYDLFASRRLLLQVLHQTYREEGKFATLLKWEKHLRAFEPGKGLRAAGYKEATLFVLSAMRSALGSLDCAQSNLVELLGREPRGVIFEVDTLPVEHYSFFVSFLHRWLFQWRSYAR